MSSCIPLFRRPSELWASSSLPERIALGTIAGGIATASWYLWPFWRESSELSHGFFAPLGAVVLLWRSREEPEAPSLTTGGWRLPALQALLVGGGISVAIVAAMAGLAQGPLHSQTAFLAGLTTAALVCSGGLALAAAPAHLVRANGAVLCAALLWCFAVPLPSGTLARVSLFLQNAVTAVSLKTLLLLGIPAMRHGNIIELANGAVGVEEACSGIRSLTACLFAGTVLGGFMLHGLTRRLVAILGAGVLAVAMNLLRSLALCLCAAYGVRIGGFWHDATGYAVLGATALVLYAGCLALGPGSAGRERQPASVPTQRPFAPLALHAFHACAVVACVLLVTQKTGPAPVSERSLPDLQALMTFDSPDWIRRSDESIIAFGQALNTSLLRQETYLRGDTQLTFYMAYWTSKQASLGSVALHTPDVCLPGVGWTPRATPAPVDDYPFSAPRRFAFEKNDRTQHIWFWHYFAGHVVEPTAGVYPWQLAPLLLKRGIGARAPQWVVRLSSNRPLETLRDEPIVKEFVARLHAAGLSGDAIAR